MMFEEEIEIKASKERVWEVISDLSRETEFWHGIRSVRVISQSGNIIEREVTQNFRKHKVLQRVVIHPGNSVETYHLRGMTRGVKVVSLEPLSEQSTRVRVFWDVRVTGLMWFLSPWVKSHIREGAVNALRRIRAVCEGREEELLED
jgi:carbon monoxide dehydrogenase subunit G